MYIVDKIIRERLEELEIRTAIPTLPFEPDEQIQPCSIDFRLDGRYWKPASKGVVDLRKTFVERVRPRRQWRSFALKEGEYYTLKPGETWRYLVYFGEGAFLMEYDGVEYDGDQDLFEHAEQEGDSNGYEEWLRINCSNNQWGWLFMGDITLDDGTFISPNITGYGVSEDLK